MVKKFFSIALLLAIASTPCVYANTVQPVAASSSATSGASHAPAATAAAPAASASETKARSASQPNFLSRWTSRAYNFVAKQYPISSALVASAAAFYALYNYNDTVRGWFGASNDDCRFCPAQTDDRCGCNKPKPTKSEPMAERRA